MTRILLVTTERELAETLREIAGEQGWDLTVMNEPPPPDAPKMHFHLAILDPRPYPDKDIRFGTGEGIMIHHSSPIQADRLVFVGNWEKYVGRMNSYVTGASGYIRIHPPGGPTYYKLKEVLLAGIRDALAMPIYEAIDFHDLFPDREFYRQALESMQVPVLFLTTDGEIRLMNLRALAYFDYPTHMVIHQDWKMLISEEDRAHRADDVLRQINSWFYYECTLRFVDRHGREFPAIVSSSRVFSSEAVDCPHLVLAISDMTETEELQRQINLLQRMESVERVVAGMTHEFNNILTAIMGHAELLVEDLPQKTDSHQSAHIIRREAERARQLTQRLLGLSSQRQFVPTPLSVNDLVRESVALLKPTYGERIHLRCRLTDQEDIVRGDVGLLQQVLLNLCLNARDAIAGTGEVTIETAQREMTGPDCRFQRDRSPGMYLEICVRDTGSGMTVDTMDRVFEPFFTTKLEGAGSGLGMSVVHGIIRNHGGHVDIESQIGEGTSVFVRLPLSEGDPMRGTDDDELKDSSRDLKGTEEILLIDDERNILAYSQRVLSQLGYTVICVSSSELARDAFHQHRDRVSLIVLDLSMPGISGRELLREFRHYEKEIPIILATGFAPGGVDDELVEQVQGFIKKPYRPRELAEQVREVIDAAETS